MHFNQIKCMLFSENTIAIPESKLTVSYSDEGPKAGVPVIIFIHGFPFNKLMWNNQIDILRKHYRVIAYDIRGHGNSEGDAEDFSIAQFAEDLIFLMNALDIKRATLCGLSMGGYIVLNAMENYSSRFEALILCDTQCKDDSPEAKEKRLKAIESIRLNGKEHYANESVKNLFAPESFATRRKEIAGIKEMIINTSIDTLDHTLQALANRNETCSKLPEIMIPVLIMTGTEDKITPPAAAQFMSDNIRDSRLCLIEHSGHISNVENPESFNEQLTKFLAEVYK